MTLLAASAITNREYSAPMIRSGQAAPAPDVTGIDAPGDFYVRGLGAAGVSIDAGSGPIASTYSGAAFRQTYRVANNGATDDAVIAVPAAGSTSPRTDYLILRVYDPEFTGQTDPTGKGNGLVLVPALPIGYPYLPLAKIVQPAGNLAGIQQSMITDLRVIASPRNAEVWRSMPSLPDDEGMVLNNATTGEVFPNANGPQDIPVPTWAVWAKVECRWLGVFIPAGANPNGQMWVEYGPSIDATHRERSTQKFSFDSPGVAATNDRDTWEVSDTVYIPAAYRGTTQNFRPIAAYAAAYNTANGKVQLTATSGMVMKVRFEEAAD